MWVTLFGGTTACHAGGLFTFPIDYGKDCQASVRHHLVPKYEVFLGLLQVPDSANIQVIWCPANLVSDKGSRFREGRIKGDQDVLIDKTGCTEDGLAT